MLNEKKLGIWMDHANAHLIEFTSDEMNKNQLVPESTSAGNEEIAGNSENIIHNKEQDHPAGYYKLIGEEIKKYGHVLLFGPTNAKSELINTLKDDHHFDKIHIRAEQTDKLTENQQHAFVRDYFSKPLTSKKV